MSERPRSGRRDAPFGRRAKAAYAGAVRRIHRALAGRGDDRPAPPPARRWRHWVHSLPLVHDVDALVQLDVPWWTYRSIAHVDQWLAARTAPVRVFEYGSGASTTWLARRSAEVHSVEHDPDFARHMATLLAPYPHVSLRVVRPVPAARPRVGSSKEGHEGLDFADYVRAIDDVPGTFDLVVIDGRARGACLSAAVRRLRPGGLVVFDNSRRRRYRSAIRDSGLEERVYRGLTPTLPYPEQTSLLRRR